jgi:hypothetical protein
LYKSESSDITFILVNQPNGRNLSCFVGTTRASTPVWEVVNDEIDLFNRLSSLSLQGHLIGEPFIVFCVVFQSFVQRLHKKSDKTFIKL